MFIQSKEDEGNNYKKFSKTFAKIFNSKSITTLNDLSTIENKDKIIFLVKLGKIRFEDIKNFNFKIDLLENNNINFIIL